MPVHYIVVPFRFLSRKFGHDMMEKRHHARLAQHEVGSYINRSGSWVSYVERDEGTIDMNVKDFINICNMFDLDPRNYFELGE